MESKTWEQAAEQAKQESLKAGSRVANRNSYGEVVTRISYGPKGPGKVRVEILETLPEIK